MRYAMSSLESWLNDIEFVTRTRTFRFERNRTYRKLIRKKEVKRHYQFCNGDYAGKLISNSTRISLQHWVYRCARHTTQLAVEWLVFCWVPFPAYAIHLYAIDLVYHSIGTLLQQSVWLVQKADGENWWVAFRTFDRRNPIDGSAMR